MGNIGYEQRMNYTGFICRFLLKITRLSLRKRSKHCCPFGTGRKDLWVISSYKWRRLQVQTHLYGTTYLFRAVKGHYVCTWVDAAILHGYDSRITQVFHLMVSREEATAAQIHIAETFSKIRKALHKRQFTVASELISFCESDPNFTDYAKVLAILDEHCIQESFMERKAPISRSSTISTNTCSTTTYTDSLAGVE